MVRRRKSPSQTWRTFLENHVKSTVSVDFFHGADDPVSDLVGVSGAGTRPSTDFPLCRHRASHSGMERSATSGSLSLGYRAKLLAAGSRSDLRERVCRSSPGYGVKQVLSAPRSPWQRAYVERSSEPFARECLDHVIIFNERSLYRHLRNFFDYYH